MRTSTLVRIGLASVIGLAATYGCKSPVATPTSRHAAAKPAAKAKVEVNYGNVAVNSNADMVVRFKLSDVSAKKYTLESLSNVDHVQIQVTDSLGAVHTAVVTLSELLAAGGNEASASFSGLPLGTATVEITAYDAADTLLFGPKSYEVTINDGQIAVLHATCEVGTGALEVDFTCENMCEGASPSPSPSGTPDCSEFTTLVSNYTVTYADEASDLVGRTGYGADGIRDGHFVLSFDNSAPIDIIAVNFGTYWDGTIILAGVWATDANGVFAGLYHGGTAVTTGPVTDLSPLITLPAGHNTLDLYGSDTPDGSTAPLLDNTYGRCWMAYRAAGTGCGETVNADSGFLNQL